MAKLRTTHTPHNWFCDTCEMCGWAPDASAATTALAAHIMDTGTPVLCDLAVIGVAGPGNPPAHRGHIEPTAKVQVIR